MSFSAGVSVATSGGENLDASDATAQDNRYARADRENIHPPNENGSAYMVYERAQLYIAAGSEAAFEAAMSESIGLLQSAAGCQGAQLTRGVEEASTYLLLVEWGAVEDHVAFTKTDEYKRFGQALGPHFAKPPEVLHFAPV